MMNSPYIAIMYYFIGARLYIIPDQSFWLSTYGLQLALTRQVFRRTEIHTVGGEGEEVEGRGCKDI